MKFNVHLCLTNTFGRNTYLLPSSRWLGPYWSLRLVLNFLLGEILIFGCTASSAGALWRMMAADAKQRGPGLGVRKRITSAEGESALQLLMKVVSGLCWSSKNEADLLGIFV